MVSVADSNRHCRGPPEKPQSYLLDIHSHKTAAVAYQLNLYRGRKLTSTEIVDAPLEEAKEIAIAALGSGQADRAELVNNAGSVIFQRWAVL